MSGYAYTLGTLLVALVLTPVLARSLGPVRFGIWSVVGASVSYLEVLELGFGSSTVTLVADRSARGDEAGVRRAVATSFWVLAVPGAIALAGAGLAAALLPRLLDLPPGDITATRLLLLLLALDLAVSIPSDTFGGALTGLHRIDLINWSLLGGVLVSAAAALGVIGAGGGLLALGVAVATVGLIGQLIRFLLARRLLPGLSVSPSLVRRDDARETARTSGWFALADLNKIVVQRLDIVLVGAVVGVAPAGLYAAAQKLALLVTKAAEPATLVLFPHSAAMRAHGDAEALRATLRSAGRLAMAVSVPLTVPLVVFARPLLQLWVGNGFLSADRVVQLLGLAAVASTLAAAVQLVLKGMREGRSAGLGAGADAGVNLALSITLGVLFGVNGVALATLAAALVAVAVLVPSACRATGLGVGTFFAGLAAAHLVPAGAAAGLALLLTWLHPHPGLLVLPEAAAVLGLHLALLSRFALEPAERTRLRRLVAGRLPSRQHA